VALALLLGGLAHADDEGWELVRSPASTVKAGQKTSLSLSIVPRTGHRLLAGGPVLVRLTGEGLKPLKPALAREDAVDPRADVPRFELPITAEKKGEAQLHAAVTFWICRGDRCRPVETTASWTLAVN
jgi:hypothetical protein